ncbi:hypothetical protein [Phenylobacterium sp.]|jgi:hypothetical protein|uniref:hypothetical protein n=1 Tax=Phenylobacterium sp. TaxID=1871053 RepID=UPI002F945B3D
MSTQKSDARAVEYRVRADAATAAAGACQLDRMREQHEAAAAVWTQLAEAEERRARERLVFHGAAVTTVPGGAA